MHVSPLVIPLSTPLCPGHVSPGTDRKSVVQGKSGVQTCALPILVRRTPQNRSIPASCVDACFPTCYPLVHAVMSRPCLPRYRSEERRAGEEWSSDVCSSYFSKKDTAKPQHSCQLRRCMFPLLLSPCPRRYVPAMSPPVQIGRASCRGRVEFRRVLFLF